MFKITFYVPETHLEQVKSAMFSAGAGKIGFYDSCCWQVKGQGQFRALEGSQAYIGELNQLAMVEEYRVEMVVDKGSVLTVVAALKVNHPYETPAFDVVEVLEQFA